VIKMTNVIQFPTKTSQDWLMLEKTLRSILNDVNAPLEMQDTICSNMKDVFNKYNIDLSFSLSLTYPADTTNEQHEVVKSEIDKGINELGQKLHNFTNEVILDRIQLEIELYNYKNN